MQKRIWLEKQAEKNKEALLKNKLSLKKTAAYLAALQRKRRAKILICRDSLSKKIGRRNDC